MSKCNAQTLISDFFLDLKGLYKTCVGYWDNLSMDWKLDDTSLFTFLGVIMVCGEEGDFPYSYESHSEEFGVVCHNACNLQPSGSTKKKIRICVNRLIDRNRNIQ